MGDQRLRDLLEERVADLEPDGPDLGARAWAGARRARHRRAVTVGGGAVAAVLATTAVLVLPSGGGGPVPPGDQNPTMTSPPSTGPARPAPTARSAGTQHGAAIWWAPDKVDEAALPRIAVAGVPEEIDLSDGARPHQPGVVANAVFMVGRGERLEGRVVILGTDQAPYSLDVGRLDPVADAGGNAYPALGEESLSPDGRHVFFRQPSSLEVYDLMQGTWTTVDTTDRAAQGARWLRLGGGLGGPVRIRLWVPDPTDAEGRAGTLYDASGRAEERHWVSGFVPSAAGRGEGYGPVREDPVGATLSGFGPALAQAQFPGVELRDPAGAVTGGTDAVVTQSGRTDDVSVLVMPYGRDPAAGRWKACCPVVGWLGGPEVVLFESRGSLSTVEGDVRVLAWRVGTSELSRITRVTGWAAGKDLLLASWAAPQAAGS